MWYRYHQYYTQIEEKVIRYRYGTDTIISFTIKKERRYGLRKNRQPGHRACWWQTKH